MSLIEISRDEFDSLDIARVGFVPECAWYQSTELPIAATVIRDPVDHDWGYVLLAKDEDKVYRYIDGEFTLGSQEEAESKLFLASVRIEQAGEFKEELYCESCPEDPDEPKIVITTIDDEIKKFLKRYPAKLYDLTPRKFEELIASILKDMGFDVELTQATRDGGRDIIAYVRNSVCSYLTHIECKRYAPDNTVGVGIIREVIGVHNIRKATKSVIVTTSFFTRDAMKEAQMMENHLDLKDFNDIKGWLQNY